jgi:ankyrin repeat protein
MSWGFKMEKSHTKNKGKLIRNNTKLNYFNSVEIFKIFKDNNFNDLQNFIRINGINAVDRYGRNILINCIIENKTEWAKKILKEANDLDINSQDCNGWTALHFSVQENNETIAKILLDSGAIVDQMDGYGNTPLCKAVFNSRGKGDMINLLLSYGANKDLKNNSGVSPWELANTIANFNVKDFFIN